MTDQPDPDNEWIGEDADEELEEIIEVPPVVMAKLTELSNVLSEFGENWVFAADLPDPDGGGCFHYFHGANTSPVWLKGVSLELQANG